MRDNGKYLITRRSDIVLDEHNIISRKLDYGPREYKTASGCTSILLELLLLDYEMKGMIDKASMYYHRNQIEGRCDNYRVTATATSFGPLPLGVRLAWT